MKKIYFPFYALFIGLIIGLADNGRLSLYILYGVPHYDWIAHMILYGIFYGLLDSFLGGKKKRLFKRNISTAFLLTSLLITAEEVSQLFLVSRTFSLMDLLMGFLGISAFRLICFPKKNLSSLFKMRKKEKRTIINI